jgi:hypothetical protein
MLSISSVFGSDDFGWFIVCLQATFVHILDPAGIC